MWGAIKSIFNVAKTAISNLGAAAGGYFGGATGAIVSGTVQGVVTGALAGAAMSLLRGEDIGKGALKGAAFGGVLGGVTGGVKNYYEQNSLGSAKSNVIKSQGATSLNADVSGSRMGSPTATNSMTMDNAPTAPKSGSGMLSGKGAGMLKGAADAYMEYEDREDKQDAAKDLQKDEIAYYQQRQATDIQADKDKIAANQPGAIKQQAAIIKRNDIGTWFDNHLTTGNTKPAAAAA
jgi:hypothetical protein